VFGLISPKFEAFLQPLKPSSPLLKKLCEITASCGVPYPKGTGKWTNILFIANCERLYNPPARESWHSKLNKTHIVSDIVEGSIWALRKFGGAAGRGGIL